ICESNNCSLDYSRNSAAYDILSSYIETRMPLYLERTNIILFITYNQYINHIYSQLANDFANLNLSEGLTMSLFFPVVLFRLIFKNNNFLAFSVLDDLCFYFSSFNSRCSYF